MRRACKAIRGGPVAGCPVLVLLLAFLGGVLGGCRSFSEIDPAFAPLTSEETLQRLIVESDFGAAPDVDVLAVSAPLAEYIDNLRYRQDVRRRLDEVADLFRRDGGLGMSYFVDETLGASEAFIERRGNCLTYTHLFVVIAREMGMRVRYQEVIGLQRWDAVGDFLVLNRHIAAYGHFPSSGTFVVDFGEIVPPDRRFGRLISDDNARAQHFNNLGAEALTAHDTEGGIGLFNRSILIYPNLGYVWTNLGTAYARLGRFQESEWAHLEAIRLQPYENSAINQITSLYRRMGRDDLAGEYRQRSERARRTNPYYLFREGVDAIAAGDPELAIDRLKKATRRRPEELHFHLQLGKAYAMTGDAFAARESLIKAEELIESDSDELAVAQMVQAVCDDHIACRAPIVPDADTPHTVDDSNWPWG